MKDKSLMIKTEKFKLWCRCKDVVFDGIGYEDGILVCRYSYPMFPDYAYTIPYMKMQSQIPELLQSYWNSLLKK